MTQQLVFVFGTLKRDFPNHHHNLGKLLLGRCWTVEQFPLYLVGERNSPWLIDLPGEGEQVHGEVYCVDTAALASMDRLERVDQEDGYRRKTIRVFDQAGQEREAEAYLKPPSQLDPTAVQDGPFGRYTLEHASRYVSRTRESRQVA